MHHIKPQILKANGKQRSGKGFSPEEVKKAGLNLQEARAIKLPIDFRRRTAHNENIEAIKVYAVQEKAKQEPVPKPPVTETSTKKSKRKA